MSAVAGSARPVQRVRRDLAAGAAAGRLARPVRPGSGQVRVDAQAGRQRLAHPAQRLHHAAAADVTADARRSGRVRNGRPEVINWRANEEHP